jgi:uncharacterized membrane protein
MRTPAARVDTWLMDDTSAPGPPAGPEPASAAGPRAAPVSPRQLAWLEEELRRWQAGGLLDPVQARAIRERYVAVHRLSLSRLLLLGGAGFLGIGLLWLVATNLDELSPLLRFTAVTLLWLGCVLAAAVLAERGEGTTDEGSLARPGVVVLQLLAAVGFGAVVFQAAQSLQVPAYEPALVGYWGAGALLYAYATGGVVPLLVAIATTTGWYVWEVLETAEDGMGFVLPVLVAALLAGAVAAVHDVRRRTRLGSGSDGLAGGFAGGFATTWREVSALLVLVGLFAAALPYVDLDRWVWSGPVVLGGALALLAVGGAAALSRGRELLEVLAPLTALAAGVGLVMWEPPLPVDGTVAGEAYLHAAVSVLVYLVAAGWYAVLGVSRDSGRLTVLATGALVLFTTVQSFAVFAPIVTGATLFLVLGAVLLGSGYLFDRGRRRLVAHTAGVSA